MKQQGPSGPAILSLVFGILSLTGGGLFAGLPAWILGSDELRRIQRGRSPELGQGLAYAGTVLGIVGTFLGILQLAIGVNMLSWLRH